jgi:hypothetical protein
LNVSAQLFLALPRLLQLTLAAYTQRKARTAEDRDTYVLELKITRDALRQIASEDKLDHSRLLDVLTQLEGNHEILTSGAFKAIDRPEWTLQEGE